MRGIRTDFGDMFPIKVCPLPGCEEQDSLPHLQDCLVLRDLVPWEEGEASYEMVFSENLEEQKEASDLYGRLIEAREEIIEASTEEEQEEEEQV